MGYYIVAISWGSNIGPLCGGFIIEREFIQYRNIEIIADCHKILVGGGKNGSAPY